MARQTTTDNDLGPDRFDPRTPEAPEFRSRTDDVDDGAYFCENPDCNAVVSLDHSLTTEHVPYEAPDDIELITFHSCDSCGEYFFVGETEDGERRHIELVEE